MRPLIGITAYGRFERPVPSEHYAEHYTVPFVYVASVRRAGGVPVIVPPGNPLGDGWLDRIDGMVVSGGADVDPALYGAERSTMVQSPDPERDEMELDLTRLLAARDVPSLFVCRGMQMLNVAFGGSLHAHIPDLGVGDIHRGADGGWSTHAVRAEPGSRVAEAMGTVEATPYSGHHQAVDSVPDTLTVTATAPDGLVEALEAPDNRWIVGVQWHPEVTAGEDPSQQGLFDRLVSEASSR